MSFEDLNNIENKSVTVDTQQKVSIGVKIVLSVAVLGSIAAGIFIAILLS